MSQANIASRTRVALTLLACSLATWTIAPVARAEAPSVDAYAGQALVLGKPHKKTGSHPQSGAGQQRGSEEESEGESRAGPTSTQRPSSGSGGSSGPSGANGANAGEVRGPEPGRLAAGRAPGASASGGHGQHPQGGATASQTSKASQPTVTTLRPASSTLPLSGGDVALLVLAVLLVAGTAFALRRTRPNV